MDNNHTPQYQAILNDSSTFAGQASANTSENVNKPKLSPNSSEITHINAVHNMEDYQDNCIISDISNLLSKSDNGTKLDDFQISQNSSDEFETFSKPQSNPQGKLRRKFSPEEDDLLIKLISKYGAKKWDKIAQSIPGRTGRQCRDRFANYLNPTLVNGPWTIIEDRLLHQKVLEYGQHWNVIAKFFKGRSANNIKNRWYTYFCRPKKNKSNTIQYPKTNKKNAQIEIKSFEENNNLYNLNNETFYPNINNNNNHYINSIIYTNKKILFPPIYPPDNIIFPLNNELLGFLNPQFVI